MDAKLTFVFFFFFFLTRVKAVVKMESPFSNLCNRFVRILNYTAVAITSVLASIEVKLYSKIIMSV